MYSDFWARVQAVQPEQLNSEKLDAFYDAPQITDL